MFEGYIMWTSTRFGFEALFNGGLQAQVMDQRSAVSDGWVWEVGHETIEAHGHCDTRDEAMQACELALSRYGKDGQLKRAAVAGREE